MNKPTLILTADWHLREDTPTCRTDDFQSAQWEKVRFVMDLSLKYDTPIIHSGDLFNHWKPSPALLSKTIEEFKRLKQPFYTIYGNHDLPQHNLDLQYKCGIYTLIQAGVIELLDGTHWLQFPEHPSLVIPQEKYPSEKEKTILVWHVMTYQGTKPWPGVTDSPAGGLLRKYPKYDLILTGHNHKTFIETYKDRILVNPGSLTRQSANQVDHVPAVYLWFKEDNSVKRVRLPFKEGVITREHISSVEERNKRLEAFIQKLDGSWDIETSFVENLERFLQVNNIREEVKEIIYKAIDYEG